MQDVRRFFLGHLKLIWFTRHAAMPRKESELERWAVRWARARGWTVSKLTDPTGIMDHVFWVPGGAPWLIEFKDHNVDLLNSKEGVRPLQWYYLVVMRFQGYRTAIVTTREGFLKVVNNA